MNKMIISEPAFITINGNKINFDSGMEMSVKDKNQIKEELTKEEKKELKKELRRETKILNKGSEELNKAYAKHAWFVEEGIDGEKTKEIERKIGHLNSLIEQTKSNITEISKKLQFSDPKYVEKIAKYVRNIRNKNNKQKEIHRERTTGDSQEEKIQEFTLEQYRDDLESARESFEDFLNKNNIERIGDNWEDPDNYQFLGGEKIPDDTYEDLKKQILNVEESENEFNKSVERYEEYVKGEEIDDEESVEDSEEQIGMKFGDEEESALAMISGDDPWDINPGEIDIQKIFDVSELLNNVYDSSGNPFKPDGINDQTMFSMIS